MFKKFFVSLFIVIAVLSANAQQVFKNGDMALNAGIGLGWGYSSGYTGISTLAPMPSFNASFEVGIIDLPDVGVISVGGFGSFRTTWNNGNLSGYDYTYKYTNTVIAARGVFHLGFLNTDKFDVYGGIHTGVRFSKYTYTSDFLDVSDNDVYFVHDVFAGGRYMMSSKLGVFAEVGYGISFLKVGITLKVTSNN